MIDDKKTYDLIVVGAGIFGLWTAKWAGEAGLNVLLAESCPDIGQGASNGLLGALMPFLPTGWIEKKQFQFDALLELEMLTQKLEDETGLQTGYGRVGRIMPVRKERFLKEAEARKKAAEEIWKDYTFAHYQDNRFENWLSGGSTPLGYLLDTFAARLNPRLYSVALKAALPPCVTIRTGYTFEGFENNIARFNNGREKVSSKAIVLAQGYQTFSYPHKILGLDIGTGIKGQAATFKLSLPEGLPILYDDGIYVVPHQNGFCAVGSTSEKTWEDCQSTDEKLATDEKLETLIQKAFNLCPLLKEAIEVERWAGIRPKCHEREPIVGKLFEDKPIYVATGGFKISFGIAHRLSKALIEEISGQSATFHLPDNYAPEYHMKAALT